MASMTAEEKAAKKEIIQILKKEGYGRYAKLLEHFFVNLTNNPNHIGYLDLRTGVMVLNRGLDIDQVSVVVRHELVHQYLNHVMRLLEHLAKKQGWDASVLEDKVKIKELGDKLFRDINFNIAGDYEISNRAYTDADKDTIRNLKFNGQIVSGLVTEDDHPEWANLTIEELYDKLEEMKPPKIENVFGAFKDPTTFVGIDGVTYGA